MHQFQLLSILGFSTIPENNWQKVSTLRNGLIVMNRYQNSHTQCVLHHSTFSPLLILFFLSAIGYAINKTSLGQLFNHLKFVTPTTSNNYIILSSKSAVPSILVFSSSLFHCQKWFHNFSSSNLLNISLGNWPTVCSQIHHHFTHSYTFIILFLYLWKFCYSSFILVILIVQIKVKEKSILHC